MSDNGSPPLRHAARGLPARPRASAVTGWVGGATVARLRRGSTVSAASVNGVAATRRTGVR